MSVKRESSTKPKWRVFTSHVSTWINPTTVEGKPTSTGNKRLPYFVVTLMVIILTIVFWLIQDAFTPVNIALLYLLPVLITAVRWGLWPSFYAAGLGVAAFDFFFIQPLLTFSVADTRYLISFAVYLAVATFTASLASQLRRRFKEAMERESITSALYTLSTDIAAARSMDTVLSQIVRHAYATFGLATAIVLPDAEGKLVVKSRCGIAVERDADIIEPRVLRWVYDHGKMAEFGTRTNSETSLLYTPLKTDSQIHGVMCIAVQEQTGGIPNHRFQVIQALSGLASVSIARIHFEEEAKIAHLTAESERLRTALLDSISHELRTPLATILGSVTAILDNPGILSERDRSELLETVREGTLRMNRLVSNLLGMVRLESGMLHLQKKWCDVSDIVGVALSQVQDSLQTRTVNVRVPNHLPVLAADDVLLEQVLVNLLSNAIKYSQDGSIINLEILEYDGVLTIQIRDHGIGIRIDDADKIFDKFYRSPSVCNIPGTGLGLAICKGIVEAHGGQIFARPAEKEGTIVTIQLPVGDVDGELA